MNLSISTLVAQSPEAVMSGFTESLFLQLNPPFPYPKAKLLRFDGCKRGHEIHLELQMGFTMRWESKITDDYQHPNEIGFVDEGHLLPFFLKSWTHRHRLVRKGNNTVIIDDITYTTPWWLPAALMYPALYFQFAYRKPIYRQTFGNIEN